MVDLVKPFDPRHLLNSAFFYRIVQHALAPRSSREGFISEYVRPNHDDRILDVGCGPADDLAYMPKTVRYVGFDVSERYIEAARRRWGQQGTFFQAEVSAALLPGEKFDIVVANGVMHHLDDAQVVELLRLAESVLRPGGRLVSKDPVIVTPQRKIARFLVQKDRGEHVRDPEGYLRLANAVFSDVSVMIRGDMLRCPYDHAILAMRRDRA